MPWTLYRYILVDLLRTLVLTTVVLVTVIAFGAAIKPLANERLLSAGQTIKYVILAIIPMLQFALPFAGGFAATLTLHRMTTDNEVLAAAASGLSYRRLLVPIVALGLVLLAIMVMLTQWIVPRFWGLMEGTVARDVTRIFQASIERGVPFKVGSLQIYADRIVVDPDPADTEADTRLILLRVAAAELDDDHRVARDWTAAQAVVDTYRRADRTFLKLVMTDTVSFKPSTGELAGAPRFEPGAIMVPSITRDNLAAMTRSQLLGIRGDPDRYTSIDEARRTLADRLYEHELWSEIDRLLGDQGRIELRGAEARRYVVHAGGCTNGRFVSGGGEPARVTRFVGDAADLEFSCADVRLERPRDAQAGDLRVDLVMVDVGVVDLRDRTLARNRRERLAIPGLSLTRIEAVSVADEPSVKLLERAQAAPDPSAGLTKAAERLDGKTQRLRLEITGRLLKRHALSATSVLLLLVGALFAMWLRDSLPLTIYLLSFLPAVLDLIIISGGEQVVRDGYPALGLMVMWSGNGLLLGLSFLAYLRLMRN